jgi:hypothetical protein
MQAKHSPGTFRPIPCNRCSALINHPTWWRSDDEYIPLCATCVTLGRETFTPEGATQQALAIMLIHMLINEPPARHESQVAR